jgi:hypothetical protein
VTVTGGHNVSQFVLHALVVAVSGLNAYTVLPLAVSTMSVSFLTLAIFTGVALAPVDGAVVAGEAVVLGLA